MLGRMYVTGGRGQIPKNIYILDLYVNLSVLLFERVDLRNQKS